MVHFCVVPVMAPPTRLEIKLLLIEVVKAYEVGPEDIDDTSPLIENASLGLDSVDLLELTIVLTNRYGVRVDDSHLARTVLCSVDSIVRFITETRPLADQATGK